VEETEKRRERRRVGKRMILVLWKFWLKE